jgi:RimJ/RimL family protein N-acetyltransferase
VSEVVLRPLEVGDLDDLHALYRDPGVWEHQPSGVFTTRGQSEALLEFFVAGWRDDGLSNWAAVDQDGAFLGHGGARLIHDRAAWNIGYRVHRAHWGRGIGSLLAQRGVEAAHETDRGVPVTAKLLEHNEASRRTAEKAGLQLIWRGRDLGNADETAVRLVFADRELDAATLRAHTHSFMR